MIGLSYNRLLSMALSVPPYRGTTNRYPIGNRKQNNKYFFKRDDNGKNVFDVVYGDKYTLIPISLAEFREGKARGESGLHQFPNTERPYGRYVRAPNIVGTVRRDNTFEFTKDSYYKGEQMFLSSYTSGWFTTDSRRGGLIYSEGGKIHPIWKGMRVDSDTVTPTTPYQVSVYHVDRKKTKGLLSKYEHFFKVSEVMLKSIDANTFMTTVGEIVDEIFGEGASNNHHNNAAYLAEAVKRVDSAPLDAFILYALGYDVGRLEYLMRYQTNYSAQLVAMESLFMNLKRKMSKELYKENKEVFKIVPCEAGTRYPASDWGTIVTVNGQQVEQYT